MSRVPKWGRGSKRRIRMIHWNPFEIAGLVLLAFALMAFGFWLARWLADFERHERDEHDSEAAALVVTGPDQPII